MKEFVETPDTLAYQIDHSLGRLDRGDSGQCSASSILYNRYLRYCR